ncbi:glycosyltransferase family 4 protein [Xylanibacillus composti]|uniref:Glycosyl transferase family 1 domain-containing protein n=1 Tax=Xylanibacillus composti TaxID=1572762 RepID=A0A8J4H098_9BACL|nr:glycosyltransferase family 4 protein [Xylanibacillus composti]GIQ68489.1 hypothetical protein XYCOK13_13130 [Xylanibacillus composti]
MRVLHLTYGQQMIALCQVLRKKGISATSCHFYGNSYEFKPDVCLHLERYAAKQRPAIAQRYMNKVLDRYDIFHFHFSSTFLPDNSDLKLLTSMGKKVIIHHRGSEVRRLSIAKKLNPYARVKPRWTDERILADLKRISESASHAIIPYYELLPYIKPFYKYIHFLPNAVDLNAIQPAYPSGTGPVRIVHAPTNQYVKGTEFIEAAIAQLKREGLDFQFTLIQKMPHDKAKAAYQQADLVIDQLHIGDYGMVSIEAMAMGKAVVCYMRKDLIPKYPGLPIVSANPDTLTDTLRHLLRKPHLLRKLGKQGRAYAQQHHNLITAADKLIRIYRKL